MIKEYCDICKKEGDVWNISVPRGVVADTTQVSIKEEDLELCGECVRKLGKAIGNAIKDIKKCQQLKG